MAERASDNHAPLPPRSAKPNLAEEYAALENTLSDSPLGRWFLAEYMRRHRTPETQLLLDAMARLETAVLKPQRQSGLATVLSELVEMSEAIARTRDEISKIRPPHQFDRLSHATEELDQIAEATERATSDILSAAEDIQEAAWTLRENGVEVALCNRIDQRAIDIYTACSFQDITGQRTAKVVQALHLIEQRIHAMIQIWGVDEIASKVWAASETVAREARGPENLENGPQPAGEGLSQDDVDRMMGVPQAAGHQAAAAPASRPPAEGPPDWPPSGGSPAPEDEARFERPEPLTLSDLHAVKREALFG